MREVFNYKGKKLNYVSEWIKGTLWIHVNGKIFSVESVQNSKKNRKGHIGVAQNKVIAPMPGKITKVLITEGQRVEKGQAVVVMEAMKMEYTLKAELAGPIEKVKAKVGNQVSLGDILIEIAQEPE
jgi:acetyl/propionyl-CoA carboxylase alpha subunit